MNPPDDVARALVPAAPRLISGLAGARDKGRDESRPGRLKPAPRLHWNRRRFLGAALVGLVPKSDRLITGSFVFESQATGHRLRDRVPFQRPSQTVKIPVVIVGGGVAGLSAVELTLAALASGQGFFGFLRSVRGSFSDPALATDEVA